MRRRIIQSIPLIIALLGIAFLYFSRWCTETVPVCYGSWIDHIYFYFTQPLYFFALYSLPLAIILIFVSRPIFNSWLKLAAWMIPLGVIYTAMTPVNFTGIGIDLFPFYRDDAARLSAEALTTVSLVLIIWKYFKARHSSTAT
ncbi:MAG: hypothetical protein B7X04_01015 [Parcubacteria group bacterium 21-54-25]|nr:MAG: hypothetical protein B7X04_01015 [Parcubacteria group bacterium 21-54-25]HQU07811.1 hypothetical protein [Candidatus Paceibacterota bacterium]